ncbi:selenocysteine-specific translation elongation factor [Cetobacterium somerae]|uniref:selenocysteine-specific translation elongation factor n=1 Tax=Cetobacterium sp. NK01 TaxID=2993530 RepID=UPI002116775E|nr:selenocysteine-specific translation elongation factor [Cetobacterium sp. NK01]MCQ8212623.1 selenocysteine-specific translation elongation factor [Cetobacterium sp. NK01]
MKNIVIGTAGHIDHGKTTLVKMLTDINTDTMKEEKERGMTIDLGFAPLNTPSGDIISIIDVPGHEKFIKNMVAGAKGIDFVLFLIACDDGIMPQTIEHKEILKLLGVKNGIIVLSKTDLVTSERIQELKIEIEESFQDSFFKSFPIVEVTSKDSSTYKTLYNIILKEINNLKILDSNKEENFFRLDIDKIYSPKGIGTIVSGTTIGNIKKGDTLTLYPQKISIKIKGIQNHGKDLEEISSHQRCALNITGTTAKEIERGNLLTNSQTIMNSKIIDVLFNRLSGGELPKNNTKIRLNIGTGEYFGKIKYLHEIETDPIFFQLIMDKDIPVDFDDIGILRTLSTSSLIGGVRILTPFGVPTKKNNYIYLQKLNYLLNKDLNLVEYLSTKKDFVYINDLNKEFNLTLNQSSFDENIFTFKSINAIIHKTILEKLKLDIKIYLEDFHNKNPLKKGVPLATVNNLFFKGQNLTIEFQDDFQEQNNFVSLKNFKIKLSKDEKKIKDEILVLLKKHEFNGLSFEILNEHFKSNRNFKNVFQYLLSEGLVLNLDDYYVLKGFYQEALSRLQLFFEKNSKITLAEFRDILKSNRKMALIYLENFDEKKVTKKIDNYRVKNNI